MYVSPYEVSLFRLHMNHMWRRPQPSLSFYYSAIERKARRTKHQPQQLPSTGMESTTYYML
jgi:hypothetical protein